MLLGMGMLMLGAGLQGTLLGLRATLEGFPTIVTGAVMSCYYIGYLGGSLAAPRLVQRVGHIRVFAAFTSLASVTILLQGVFVDPWLWGLLRAASGVFFAGIYIIAESWLNARAVNRSRASLLAVYMVVIYLGLGLGQFLLNLADPGTTRLFILSSVLISLALVPTALSAQPAQEFSVPRHIRLLELFDVSPLGVIGVLFAGAISGTLFSLGPLFAAGSGLDTGGVAAFMAASILASVATQFPVGRFSDRFDRRKVLVGVCLLSAGSAGAALLLVDGPFVLFLFAAAVYGGLSLTIYSQSISHINDHLHPSQMVAASSTLIIVNGVGSVIGPLLIAALMQWWSASAYFVGLAVLHLTMASYTLWRTRRRPPVPSAAKTSFVGVQPQAGPAGNLARSVDPLDPGKP
ncbi:MAG: MFS transporter [Burkholderiales bacterium]|nr:MFS transporter [Burkholderiales bacterium]